MDVVQDSMVLAVFTLQCFIILQPQCMCWPHPACGADAFLTEVPYSFYLRYPVENKPGHFWLVCLGFLPKCPEEHYASGCRCSEHVDQDSNMPSNICPCHRHSQRDFSQHCDGATASLDYGEVNKS